MLARLLQRHATRCISRRGSERRLVAFARAVRGESDVARAVRARSSRGKWYHQNSINWSLDWYLGETLTGFTMKLYDFSRAPSPRRVRIFAAEKGLSIPSEQVDILAGKARTPEFLAINPAGGVPVLRLDDGGYLAESDAIALYLERTHPEPNLLGREAREQATILMWERRIELNLYIRVLQAFQHGHPLAGARIKKQ